MLALVGVPAGALGQPAASHMFVVRGTVVHRSLLGRYVIIGPRGHLVPIDLGAGQRAPAVGHQVVVRIRQVGATFTQLGARTGAKVRSVELSGLVTFVSRRGRRFTLSDYYSSILIRHRLRGAVPGLFHRVTLRARFDARGQLVEQGLTDRGSHHDTLRVGGLLRFVIKPTQQPVATPSELLPAGSCAHGCLAISADDAGQTGAVDLILVPLPATSPRGSRRDARANAAASASVIAAYLQTLSSGANAPTPIQITQTTPPTPPSPTIITTGTFIITGPVTSTPAPPSAPVAVAFSPVCFPGSSWAVTLTAPQGTCIADCPPGSYSVQEGLSLVCSPLFNPITVMRPAPADTCAYATLSDFPNFLQCSSRGGITSVL